MVQAFLLSKVYKFEEKDFDRNVISAIKAMYDDLKLADNLVSTLNVFVRRTKMLIPESRIEIKIVEMIFYPGEMKLIHNNTNIPLTQRESELLQFFCLHPNKALKREEILTHVWGKNDYFLGRSMDVFVTKLRKYLKSESAVNIETVHNVGFRFNIVD